MRLFATGLFLLNLGISGLELGVGLAVRQDFFDQGLLPLLAGQAAAVVIGRPFNEGAHLRVLWKGIFARFFLDCVPLKSASKPEKVAVGLARGRTVFFGIEDASESQELELSLDLRVLDICAGHVVPVGAGIVRDSLTGKSR